METKTATNLVIVSMQKNTKWTSHTKLKLGKKKEYKSSEVTGKEKQMG